MTRRRAAPRSARVLGQWVDTYARERGLTIKRVRDWIAYMILAGNLVRVRAACEDVFNRRGTHDWPPMLDPPELWREPFAALAAEIELSTSSLEDAVRQGQEFIDAIART